MAQPFTVLYADDDPDDIVIFTEVLHDIDDSIVCITSSNGEEALRILENSKELPNIVFLDINMPILNGKDCLVKIRSNRKLMKLPVIMYSTAASDAEIKECYRLGITDYLVKANSFSKIRQDFLSIFENLISNKVYRF